MVGNSDYSIQNEEVTVKDLIVSFQNWLRFLSSKWLVFLIIGLLGGFLGFVYSYLRAPLYIARTSFVLEGGESKGGLARYAGMAAMAGIDLSGGTNGLFQGDNIIELYKSRSMIKEALLSKTHPDSDELLIERYINFNEIRNDWRNRPALLELDFKKSQAELDSQSLRLQDSLISKFYRAIDKNVLSVDKPDKKLSIIEVEVTSSDEIFSKAFNEALVRVVSDFYIQTKTKRSTDNIQILQHKVDSVRTVMSGAIYSAVSISDATPNLNPTRQVQRVAPAQEAQFSAEANKAMLGQLLQNLELAKMTLLQEQPLIQLVDEPVFPLEKDTVGKIEGIFIGGFLSVLLTALFLIVRKWYRETMA